MTIATPNNALRDKIVSACRRWISLRTVLIAAAILRLASIPVLRNYLHPVTWEFGPIARSILAGHGQTFLLPNGMRVPSAFEPPAYPYFLALFYRMFGETPLAYFLIETIQAAAGVLLVYVVYRIAELFIGKKAGIVAACVTAIFPTQVYMCNEFHPISFYIVVHCLVVFWLARYIERTHSRIDLVAAGFSMGVLLLFRSDALVLLFACAGIIVVRRGLKAVVPALVFFVIACACLAPWTIRNYRAFGKFIPVTNLAGINLWIGHNPDATGGAKYGYFSRPFPADLENAMDRIPLDRDYEVSKDVALRNLALEYARTHPRREVELAWKKFLYFVTFDPQHLKGRQPLYWAPSILLTILAIYGAVLRGRKLYGEDLLMTTSIVLALAMVVAVVYLPRYRIIIDPFLIVYTANAIVHGRLWMWLGFGESREEPASRAGTFRMS
jgi:4-amino-4-deoxy-L-arabinose transferase-like glycosyltransferase